MFGPRLPQKELVQVSVSCIKALPAKPSFITDAELKALPDGDFVLSLSQDRAKRQGYEAELEAVLLACM